MTESNYRTKYMIYKGLKFQDKLLHAKEIGEAFEIEHETKPYYVIKMWGMMRETFYLSAGLSFEFLGCKLLLAVLMIDPWCIDGFGSARI